jgi:hypothetical protein
LGFSCTDASSVCIEHSLVRMWIRAKWPHIFLERACRLLLHERFFGVLLDLRNDGKTRLVLRGHDSVARLHLSSLVPKLDRCGWILQARVRYGHDRLLKRIPSEQWALIINEGSCARTTQRLLLTRISCLLQHSWLSTRLSFGRKRLVN